ncbi:MAG: hypothetical protein D6714_08170 [Bacteroidetes bacterium]|nr:MAG: hypothetical protein D6714_08170 [Bacteroidota bacterium]
MFMRYFTLKTKAEVEAAEAEFADNPNALKRMLAEELTVRIHSKEAFESVQKVSELLFNPRMKKDMLLSLSKAELDMVAAEIPTFTIPKAALSDHPNITDLLTDLAGILSSKGEARRAIKNNAISVNKEKITSHETPVSPEALLHDRYIMIENGKRNKFLLIAE